MFSYRTAIIGTPTAHKSDRLSLLPSGPDEVHRLLLRGTNYRSPIEKQKAANAADFLMAESEGFEPSVRFPVHTLSRRAPSTARTALQVENYVKNIQLVPRKNTRSSFATAGISIPNNECICQDYY